MEYESFIFSKKVDGQRNTLLDKLKKCFFCASGKTQLALYVPGDGVVAICSNCSKNIADCVFLRCEKCGDTKTLPEKEEVVRHMLLPKRLSEKEIERLLKAMKWIPLIVKAERCLNCYVKVRNN
jgi:hypothetical protein